MRMTRWLCLCSALLFATAAGVSQDAKVQDAVTVKIVNYQGMGETIKQLRGKIVVVDLWGLT